MPSKQTKDQESGSLNSSDSELSEGDHVQVITEDVQVITGMKKRSTPGGSNNKKDSSFSSLGASDSSDDELPDAAFPSTPASGSNKKRRNKKDKSRKKTKNGTQKSFTSSPAASESDNKKGPTQTAFELIADGKPRQQVLVAMCYPRFILDEKLLEEANEKGSYKLSKTALIDEVNQRHALGNPGQTRKCSSFIIVQLKGLLETEYQISDERCIAFLKSEFQKVQKMLQNKIEV